MRHLFSFPAHIRDAVRAHVRRAVEGVSSASFRQEPAYTAALLARLAGVAYEGPEYQIRLRAYQLYEARGRKDGRELEDWFRAKEEITIKKVRTATA
jgi:hypothetical protein